ncbi:unnamed protein product [Mycena citricolor]|uniref:Uncharacterized protein n=1 Tax=Mycena citricolor TaxID=2018698 RepID=A0AAD2GUL3_9AGAR|nr:unnamed protein product [Mycena citricolor]
MRRPRKGHVLRSCGDETQPITPTARSTTRNALPELRLYPHLFGVIEPRHTRCQMPPGKPKVLCAHRRAGGTPLAVGRRSCWRWNSAIGGTSLTADATHVRTRFLQPFSSLPSISTVTGELLDQLVAVKILDEESRKVSLLGICLWLMRLGSWTSCFRGGRKPR